MLKALTNGIKKSVILAETNPNKINVYYGGGKYTNNVKNIFKKSQSDKNNLDKTTNDENINKEDINTDLNDSESKLKILKQKIKKNFTY